MEKLVIFFGQNCIRTIFKCSQNCFFVLSLSKDLGNVFDATPCQVVLHIVEELLLPVDLLLAVSHLRKVEAHQYKLCDRRRHSPALSGQLRKLLFLGLDWGQTVVLAVTVAGRAFMGHDSFIPCFNK